MSWSSLVHIYQCSSRIYTWYLLAISNAYLPDLDRRQFPTFVVLPSTENISIESVWSYWLKAKGYTLHNVIISGCEKGHFIIGNELHACMVSFFVALGSDFYWSGNCFSGCGQRLFSAILTISSRVLTPMPPATSITRNCHLESPPRLFMISLNGITWNL